MSSVSQIVCHCFLLFPVPRFCGHWPVCCCFANVGKGAVFPRLSCGCLFALYLSVTHGCGVVSLSHMSVVWYHCDTQILCGFTITHECGVVSLSHMSVVLSHCHT